MRQGAATVSRSAPPPGRLSAEGRLPTASLRFPGILVVLALGLTGCISTSDQGAPTPASPAEQPPQSVTPSEPTTNERAGAIVDAWSTRERVASITMGTTSGTDIDHLASFVSNLGIGGFILMGDNVPATPADLAELTAEVAGDPELPVLMAVDQEGGVVSRLPWDDEAAADTLKHEPVEATETAFGARAALLEASGISVNFGVVADVASESTDFIFDRVLGTTPDDASARVAAAVRGESGHVLTTLKHFPGHGAAGGDSHVSIPSASMPQSEWIDSAGLPFAAGIDAGAELLMFGHLSYTDVDDKPASLSPVWHRIAREDLEFDGVIVTDDLGMLLSSGDVDYEDPVQNAIAALDAGNDLLLWIAGSDPTSLAAMIDGVTEAVDRGDVSEERLIDAAVRVTAIRLEEGA